VIGHDVGKRWNDLFDASVSHINDHLSAFYDAHLLMAYLGANSNQHVDEFLESLQQYVTYADILLVDSVVDRLVLNV